MADIKTKKTSQSVDAFLTSIVDEKKRQDSYVILDLIKEASGAEPKMWGDSIVGFGDYHYKYATGRENDWFYAGFSPRKQNITLYLATGFDQFSDLMQKLGRYKTGKACLYIQRIEDINQDVLKELVRRSIQTMQNS